MTCREFVARVTELLEDALPAAERERLLAHLDACDGCEAHLEQMRAVLRVAGALPAEGLSDRAERRLLAALRGGPAEPGR